MMEQKINMMERPQKESANQKGSVERPEDGRGSISNASPVSEGQKVPNRRRGSSDPPNWPPAACGAQVLLEESERERLRSAPSEQTASLLQTLAHMFWFRQRVHQTGVPLIVQRHSLLLLVPLLLAI